MREILAVTVVALVTASIVVFTGVVLVLALVGCVRRFVRWCHNPVWSQEWYKRQVVEYIRLCKRPVPNWVTFDLNRVDCKTGDLYFRGYEDPYPSGTYKVGEWNEYLFMEFVRYAKEGLLLGLDQMPK